MRYAILFVMLVGLSSSSSLAQDSVTITSDPNDLSRPISTLLGQLRQRDKIAVTYEDPRYSNSSEIQDVTSEVARNVSEVQKKYGPRTLVPKGKAFNFVYTPQDLRTLKGAEDTIARMLQEYGTLGGSTFAVVRDGVRLHVLPKMVWDATGQRVKQDSILETVISVPSARRDGGELLQAICDQIQKQTNYEIGVGPSVPGNNLARYHTTEGIENQTARAALQHLLDSATLAGSFVWDLYYGPDVKYYGLNFSYLGPAGQGAK
jgi:hypothetical protein